MTRHLFVYGTLLPELAPASVRPELLRLEAAGSAIAWGWLYDLGPYPGLVLDRQSGAAVKGELWALPGERDSEPILAMLDRYEDAVASDAAAGLFVRKSVVVDTPERGQVAAWVYVYNRDPAGATLIPHGDYRRWLAERQATERKP